MGAWGEGPFDNDAAGDMVAVMMRSVHVVTDPKNKLRAQRLYAEARAVARFILFAHGTDLLGGPSLETVLRALVRMRSDTEWLSSWRTPRTIAAKLDAEIEEVLEKIKGCKSCRNNIHIGDMMALAKIASAVKPGASKWPARINRKVHLRKLKKKRRIGNKK